MGTPRLQIRPDNPDFLDLPWQDPVDVWDHERLVDMPAGVHRHPVVFVAYDEGVYAIKELPVRVARNEYEVLGEIQELTHRAAEPAGLMERTWLDSHEEQSAAVITRYVEHSFPFRSLVTGPGFGARRRQIVDALASLMVELHLNGFFWGDCSLSNALYRYDAGEIESIMIDAETSEIHEQLSHGQREHDIVILTENVAGEMADIAAMSGADIDEADLWLGEDIATRYHDLWKELNDVLIIAADEGYRIRERINRLNEMGFSVHDVEIEPTAEGRLVRMTARVGGRTFNSDRLASITGIDASENQARVILGDLSYFLAKNQYDSRTQKSVGVFKWLTNVFQPLIDRIAEVWHGDDPLQGYSDFLHHRMDLATQRGTDVTNEEAFASWMQNGFPGFPLEG